MLVVDRDTVAARLQRHPILENVLGPKWIDQNTKHPPWQPPLHPLMPWLWSDWHHDFLSALESAITLLTAQVVSGHPTLLKRLKHERGFRPALPELFLAADFVREGYGLVLPAQRGVRNPDLRISRPDGTLDIEVTAFEQTKDVQDMDVMLTALREGEPYVYERSIPDSAKFAREDIVAAGEEIARIFAGEPFRRGSRTVPIGKTGYDIRIRPDSGQGSGSSWGFSPDPVWAARKVNDRLKLEADQLPGRWRGHPRHWHIGRERQEPARFLDGR